MATGDLTTLDSVKAILGFESTDNDVELGGLITALSVFVASELNRQLVAGPVTETRQGNGKDRFMLRQYPVLSITSVQWAGGPAITNFVDLFDTGSGIATDGRSLILLGYTMPYRQPVRISYVAGYDLIPADLSYAVAQLVAEAYTAKTHIGETSHSSNGATTVSFDRQAMHAAIAIKLANYMPVAPLC